MPDINAWINNSRYFNVSEEGRAVFAWNRIQDKPISITIIRGGVAQDAQTVRLEYWRGGDVQAEIGTVAVTSVTVFGVKNHPSVTDTDLQRGDRFIVGDSEYEITDVVDYPGEIQASGERLS